MNFFKFIKFLSIFCLITLTLPGCKKIDWDEEAVFSGTERARKNVEEGRGFKFGMGKDEGQGSFGSSNPLWIASIETLDFMTLSSVDYAGGIIITDWYSESNNSEAIKITIRFYSDEIRADGLQVFLHKKICDTNNFCITNKIDNTLSIEIKDTILKKAALINQSVENKKKGKEKDKGKKKKQV